jgi:Flp pilus assembly protein TadD
MRFRHAILLLLTFIGAGALLALDLGDHMVSGFVREEGSNDPVAGATLEISPTGSTAMAQVFSGMEGQFVFRGLQEGDYVITAKKEGYDSASAPVNVRRTGVPQITISLRRASAAGVHPGGPISAHQLQVPKKAHGAYEKGYTLLEDKNKAADSIPEFEKALKEFPTYYEAYTELGTAKNRLGNASEAEASFKKAVELSDGTFFPPLYRLADLYNDQGKYQEAEPVARQAIALDASAWSGFFELARSLMGLKRVSEAETSAIQARDLSPQTPQIYLVLANIHALQQKYPAAVQDLDAYLKLVPDSQNSESVRRTRDKLQQQIHPPPGANPPAAPKPAAPQP